MEPIRSQVHDLLRMMAKIDRRFRERLFDALAREPGFEMVRPPYAIVLRNMSPKGSRITDIARRAGVTKQAIGQLVTQMEADGIVEVVADATDARAKLVRIPAANRARHERVAKIAQGLAKEMEAKLGAEGVRELHRLLSKLADD